MRLPSRSTRSIGRLAACAIASGLAIAGIASGAGADTGTGLTVVLDGHGGGFSGTVEIACESAAVPPADGVDIGSAVRSTRSDFSVPPAGTTTLTIADLSAGTACAVTATGPTAADLGAVDGGTPLVGSDGQLRGVAVTVDRGTTATAHLTYEIPFAIASSEPSKVEASTTTAAGSGSAASTPPPLPGGDGAASAAAPVALAAARSTTTASSAALPDTSGSGTTLVLASIGVLLCGAAAYILVVRDRREPHVHD
jgi:hypothetical protein